MRLVPLPAEQWDDEVPLALTGMLPRNRHNPEGAGTALSTLVRHPDLTERQRMDFVFTVGSHGMLAMAFNTFGVQLEDER